jgi:hypothetical protein
MHVGSILGQFVVALQKTRRGGTTWEDLLNAELKAASE